MFSRKVWKPLNKGTMSRRGWSRMKIEMVNVCKAWYRNKSLRRGFDHWVQDKPAGPVSVRHLSPPWYRKRPITLVPAHNLAQSPPTDQWHYAQTQKAQLWEGGELAELSLRDRNEQAPRAVPPNRTCVTTVELCLQAQIKFKSSKSSFFYFNCVKILKLNYC